MRAKRTVAMVFAAAVALTACTADDVALSAGGETATPIQTATPAESTPGAEATSETLEEVSSVYDPVAPLECDTGSVDLGPSAGVFLTIENVTGLFVAEPVLFAAKPSATSAGVPLPPEDVVASIDGDSPPDDACVVDVFGGSRFLESDAAFGLDLVTQADVRLGVVALIPCTGQLVGGLFAEGLDSDEQTMTVAIAEPVELELDIEQVDPTGTGCTGDEQPLVRGDDLLAVTAVRTS